MAEKVQVDPGIVSCAVRYALGRQSYITGWVADTVKATWSGLGTQREVIREDLVRYLTEDHRRGALHDADLRVWRDLLAWIDDR